VAFIASRRAGQSTKGCDSVSPRPSPQVPRSLTLTASPLPGFVDIG